MTRLYIQYLIYLFTNCHACDVGYPLTVSICCLLRFVIRSSLHGAFSLSINVHAQNSGTQEFLLRKS